MVRSFRGEWPHAQVRRMGHLAKSGGHSGPPLQLRSQPNGTLPLDEGGGIAILNRMVKHMKWGPGAAFEAQAMRLKLLRREERARW